MIDLMHWQKIFDKEAAGDHLKVLTKVTVKVIELKEFALKKN